MSESCEVYDSKPNPEFAILRPNSQVATVLNTYSVTLEKVFINDGSFVNEGDTLYIIEHDNLLAELDYYNEQLIDTDNTLNMLNKYKKSVEDGVNYFTEDPAQEEYFVKTKSYLINYKMAENDLDYNIKERDINLNSINEQLDNYNNERNVL